MNAHGNAARGGARTLRQAAHRRSRRDELVMAALAAIRSHGPGVGMDDIAAQAGVTKPVVYRYFADKADLHAAVGQHVAAALLADLTRELGTDRPPLETFTAAVDAYLQVIERDPDVYRFVIRRPAGRGDGSAPPGEAAIARDYAGMIAAAVSRLLTDQLRAAGRDTAAAEPWAYGIVGSVRSAGEWWLERPAMSRSELTGHLTQLLWRGLDPAGPAGPGEREAAGAGSGPDGAADPAGPGEPRTGPGLRA